MTSRRVTIFDYQSSWPSDFEAIALELHKTLADYALSIDHIGSTAVIDLCAKDIIDVQVTVQQLDANIAQLLLGAGFTTYKTETFRQDHVPSGLDPNPDDWTKLFFMQRPGTRRSNIHIRQLGRPNQRYALLVRDFLRADKKTAEAYGKLKKRLAAALADPHTYPEVKDPVCDLIFHAAQRWALQTQ